MEAIMPHTLKEEITMSKSIEMAKTALVADLFEVRGVSSLLSVMTDYTMRCFHCAVVNCAVDYGELSVIIDSMDDDVFILVKGMRDTTHNKIELSRVGESTMFITDEKQLKAFRDVVSESGYFDEGYVAQCVVELIKTLEEYGVLYIQ
jgi:hypothetical protein